VTGVREHFTDLRDTEVRMEIAFGDDTLVRVVGHGIVTFHRDACHLFRSGMFSTSLG
jgi:hypothetical protein